MKLPSVTKILSPWSDFSRVPPDVLAKAVDRGIKVHAACRALVYGLWPLVDVDTLAYITSFAGWLESSHFQVIASEIELADHNLGFCGHPDLIGEIAGEKIVIDLKTPATVAPTWRLQLAAYRHLATLHLNFPVNRVATLRLSRDGKQPIFDEYTSTLATDFAIFLNCLSAYRYFKGDSRD